MRKSYSGFDIGQKKAYGSFFSNRRQEAAGNKSNFFQTEKMKGVRYIDRLIAQ